MRWGRKCVCCKNRQVAPTSRRPRGLQLSLRVCRRKCYEPTVENVVCGRRLKPAATLCSVTNCRRLNWGSQVKTSKIGLAAWLMCLLSGCSNAPVADLMDFLVPSRMRPDKTAPYGGVCNPAVPPGVASVVPPPAPANVIPQPISVPGPPPASSITPPPAPVGAPPPPTPPF
jgi:hypothetical protein